MAERKPRKTRINAKVRMFLSHHVFDAWSLEKCCKAMGWSKDWGHRLFKRPDVLSLRNEMMGVLRASEGARTIARIAQLADHAKSEHVRMAANEWLAGIDGTVPIARSENVHLHQHSNLIPGLTIVFNPFQPHDLPGGPVIEGAPQIKRIGTPVSAAQQYGLRPSVPHPENVCMGNGRALPVPVPHPAMRKLQVPK